MTSIVGGGEPIQKIKRGVGENEGQDLKSKQHREGGTEVGVFRSISDNTFPLSVIIIF